MTEKKRNSVFQTLFTPRSGSMIGTAPKTPNTVTPEKLEEKSLQRKDSNNKSFSSPMPQQITMDVNNLSPREGELEEDPEFFKVSVSELLKDSKKSGYLDKEGGSIKSWKKRFFVLNENFLYYFEDESVS